MKELLSYRRDETGDFLLRLGTTCCPNFHVVPVNRPESWSSVPLSRLYLLLKPRANKPLAFVGYELVYSFS